MVILLLLALLTPLPPAPATYVTDAANVLPDDRERALNERLAQFDRDTTNQLLVYVDRRVPAGTTLEEMGAEAIRTWGVGDATKDNGAILFLFIDDRASRIEVGYGLEGVLTDAHAKRILVSLRPALRAGDYATAAEEGADAIARTITGQRRAPLATRVPVQAPQPDPLFSEDFIAAVGIFLLAMLFLGVAAFVLFKFSPKGYGGHSSSFDFPSSSDSSSDSSSSWSSSSSSSSSDSSSSFSGGGGSGGGGGASDRW